MAVLRLAEELTIADVEAYPVWEYTNAHEDISETVVTPVERLPVNELSNRIVGTQVRLANGTLRWAVLCNVALQNTRYTEQFLCLGLLTGSDSLYLARYHDPDVGRHGPHAFAASLGLPIEEVFPIAYDIRHLCEGDPAALVGWITQEPRERLTEAELMKLLRRL